MHNISERSSLSFLFQKWSDWVLEFPGLDIFYEFVYISKFKNVLHITWI